MPSFNAILQALAVLSTLHIAQQFQIAKIANECQYSYKSQTCMKEGRNAENGSVCITLSAVVDALKIWESSSNSRESIFQLKISNLFASNRNNAKSSSDEGFSKLSTFVYVKNNAIERITSVEKSQTKQNVIRGLISILFGSLDENTSTEVDVRGKCKTKIVKSGNVITKSKSQCDNFISGQHRHVNLVLSTGFENQMSTSYTFDKDGIIETVDGIEKHVMYPKVLSSLSTSIASSIKLNLLKKVTNNVYNGLNGMNSNQVLDELTKGNEKYANIFIIADISDACSGQCSKPKDVLSSLKKNLRSKKIASIESAQAFVEVLNAFRKADDKQLIDILNIYKKISPQIMDILAATQTDSSVDAAFKFINFKVTEDDAAGIDLVERFLLSLAISSHPNHKVLSKLIDILEKDLPSTKIQHSVILTIGALIKSIHLQNDNGKALEHNLIFFTNKLKSCKEDSCIHIYLQALGNAAIPSTIPTLSTFVHKGGKIATSALKALNSINIDHITPELKDALKRIYFQSDRKQDSTARIIAADILLKIKPTQCLVEKIIKSLANQTSEEVSTYILKRIQELTEKCQSLRSMVKNAMLKMSVGNYNTLAQKGLSVAMTNNLFTSGDSTATYGMHTELLKGGMLKSTSFDVEVHSNDDLTTLVSVGAFAAGLESFVGETPAAGDEEDASCGMQIKVLGVSLRPFLFFKGQGELMSLVWSGAGSEPTPALQGNMLLHDASSKIILSNGFVVDFKLIGVVSTDLSGSVQISLWSRTAESSVTNNGALVLSSKMSIQSEIAELSLRRDVETEASLNFLTTIDFYNSPSRMCMEMVQPSFSVEYKVVREESLASINYSDKKTKSRNEKVLGKSYALPSAIYKACRSLKSD